jgi:hypothetical protein
MIADQMPAIAGAPAAKAIPNERGNAIRATLIAAIKSLCQFSIRPCMPFLGKPSIYLKLLFF